MLAIRKEVVNIIKKYNFLPPPKEFKIWTLLHAHRIIMVIIYTNKHIFGR